MTAAHEMLDAYGPLVLINLPERADRRSEFAAQLAGVGLSFDHPNIRIFPAIRPDKLDGFPTLGARGCFLSHLEALKQVAENQETTVMMCEDDLDFAPDFLDRLPAVLEVLKTTPWDMFYAGYTSHQTGEMIDAATGLFRLPRDHAFQCSHFYILKGDIIPDLIGFLEQILERPAGHPDGGPMHYDGALNHFRAARPAMTTLAILPTLGLQRPSRTDVHDLKWFDKVPGVKKVVQLLRKVKR